MRVPVATLSGVAMAVLGVLPLAWFWGGLQGYGGMIAWIALILGSVVALSVWWMTPSSPSQRPDSIWDWFAIIVFTCASARAFFWLLYPVEDSWKILSPNNLGDISLHLDLIKWMAATSRWWPSSPILAGDMLRYPPGSDLFNSLLLVVGLPAERGLLWCGLGGAALTGYALWRWGGAMAITAFLFNGGFAGVVIFHGGDPDAVSQWKNLFLTLFVTQRGFLFALPAGLLLMTAWREEIFGRGRIMPFPVQALLLAALPLFSIHSALFLGIAMIGLACSSAEARKKMISLALVAWPPMALFGWLVTSGAGGPSALHTLGWKPGWMSDGTAGFWVWNFGVALPLAAFLAIFLITPLGSKDSEARAFVLPSAIVFLACLMVSFAPWAWDNMKLMIWSWLVIAPYLWSRILQPRSLIIRACALFLLFASGAATLIAGLDARHGYELIRKSDLEDADWIIRKLPPEAVIACAPEYNHPVIISGHPVVAGYEGHLWSHGLDYRHRLGILNAMMMGEKGWQQKARDLGVGYIYWSELEASRWPDSKLPWAKETKPTLHQVY